MLKAYCVTVFFLFSPALDRIVDFKLHPSVALVIENCHKSEIWFEKIYLIDIERWRFKAHAIGAKAGSYSDRQLAKHLRYGQNRYCQYNGALHCQIYVPKLQEKTATANVLLRSAVFEFFN